MSHRALALFALFAPLATGCMDHGYVAMDNPAPPPVTMDTGTPVDTGSYIPCSGEVETVDWYVEFPPTEGCDFDNGENLAPVDAVFSAHHAQHAVYEVAEDEVICDVRFAFTRGEGGVVTTLQYDDHLAFTMNDRLLFASDTSIVDPMGTDESGFAVFDWEDLRGRTLGWDTTTWSVGSDYELILPGHDARGQASLQLDDAAIAEVAAAALEAGGLDLALHGFGDNDPTDCGHTGLGFWVQIDRDIAP